jgi:hypothetical protein
MEDWALLKTKSEEPEVWFRDLGDGDSSFLMMRLFLHRLEEKGSFVDAVQYWEEFNGELVSALKFLGFPDEAVHAGHALILANRRKLEFSHELDAEIERADKVKWSRAEDVMREVLREPSRFSLDVGAFL